MRKSYKETVFNTNKFIQKPEIKIGSFYRHNVYSEITVLVLNINFLNTEYMVWTHSNKELELKFKTIENKYFSKIYTSIGKK